MGDTAVPVRRSPARLAKRAAADPAPLQLRQPMVRRSPARAAKRGTAEPALLQLGSSAVASEAALSKLKVAELREMLATRNLAVSGRKAELVQRLVASARVGKEDETDEKSEAGVAGSHPSTEALDVVVEQEAEEAEEAEEAAAAAAAAAAAEEEEEEGEAARRVKIRGEGEVEEAEDDDDADTDDAGDAAGDEEDEEKEGNAGTAHLGNAVERARTAAAAVAASGGVSASLSMDALIGGAFAAFRGGMKQNAEATRGPRKLGGTPSSGAGAEGSLAQIGAALTSSKLQETLGRSVLTGVAGLSSAPPPRRKVAPPPKWGDFQGASMTQEIRHDMEVLRLRTFLDPKKHYKGSDHKWNPKAVQIGTVIVGAHEYYAGNAGASKKERRQGALAALQRDAHKSEYAKRKFNEAQERAMAGGKKDYKKFQKKKRAKWART
eukprot:SAG11_NODE_2164_length_3728_cov_5.002204_2_plen_437_part_00